MSEIDYSNVIKAAAKVVNDSLDGYDHGAKMPSNVIHMGFLKDLQEELVRVGCREVPCKTLDGRMRPRIEVNLQNLYLVNTCYPVVNAAGMDAKTVLGGNQ